MDMNPQYMSQQQFAGGPPNFPGGRPNTGPQDSFPPHGMNQQGGPMNLPPTNQMYPNQYQPGGGLDMGPPPSQLPPPPSVMGPPPSSMAPPAQRLPAPPQQGMGPSPSMISPGGLSRPMGQMLPPVSMAPSDQMRHTPPGIGSPASLVSSSGQMGPPLNQMGPPAPIGSSPNQIGPMSGPMGPPSSVGPPTSQMGPIPSQMGPPAPMGPPSNQMGPMPVQMGPPGPSQMGPPSSQMGPMPSQMGPPGPMGPPTSQMGPLPNQMGPPGPTSQMGPTPVQLGPSGLMGPTSGQMGPPGPMGPTPGQMGPPGLMGPTPGQMAPAGPMGPTSGQMGPPDSMGSIPGQMGPPSSMGPTPGQMGPPGPMASVPGQMGPPTIQMGPSNQMGLQSNQMGPPGHMVPLPGQMGPPQSQMGPQSGQPQMGLPPTSQMPQLNRAGHPINPQMGQPPKMTALPNVGPPKMSQPGNFGPPKPSLQNQLPQKPPAAYPAMHPTSQYSGGADGSYNTSTSHLASQLQAMQLGNQRQYPGAPPKPTMNGDNMPNMPHMPPAISQNQGYINGNRGAPQQQQPQMTYPQMPGQQQQQMPGQQQQQMPGGPYPPQASYQQPQQARRLDPDQMPSPIQVTQDDQRTRSGIFCTNQKGLVPPLVSTNFITQDQGNAGPRFIRSTMYNVPTTSDMMKQTAVPFGLVISPMARTLDQEYPPPIVDFGELGPVRCIRCKAYMSPCMQFIDSGRRFQCLFCKATTEVPTEYFQHLDHTGMRVDRYERPELILGTYEFVATKDYCRNNVFPKPPAVIFVIDVSYNNMKSGLVQLLCNEMKEILKHLPIDQGHEKTKMKVGFITFNNTIHFYNVKGSLAQPQMMVVGDTQEMFMPLLDGFLCDVEDSEPVINALMDQIPTMFVETRETETVLLPAIQAGLEALKASECAGKLIVFHSTLPTADAPGRLKNRDDRKLLGTEKERTVLSPQTQAYNQLGQDCVAAGCSVDLFVVNNSYIDLATIGQICRLTGGEVFKYTYFQADIDGPRLINDVITDISRPIAFDSIMRVRTSTGVRPTDFYGHFFMSNTTDMEIAAIDCDKAVAIEIKHDDKLTEEDGVYIQVALLYTSCSGQRRLRVLNLSLKTCSQMADLYRSCELDTLVNFFAKQCIYRLLENNPKAVKDSLVNRCAQILACYRKNCASPSSAGQLILPECMKLLPLYVNCLLKSDAISGGSDMTLDDRSFVMQAVTIMDIPTSLVYFYPRLIPLHEIQNGTEVPEIPNAIRCTLEKMVENGVYLLENGIHMMMWIGLAANPEWIQSVFGVPTAGQVDVDRIALPKLDNSLNAAVRNLIAQIRTERHRHMRLTFIRQRDKLEAVFRHFLVEDRGQDNSSSYVDFLCHMHKEIRQLLS